MAVATHQFVSTKQDPPDSTLIKPSDWNAEHVITLGEDENFVTDAEKTKLANLSGTNTGDQDLSGLQVTLVSGTNIKTINNTSILGSGNITIEGGTDTSDHGELTGLSDDDHTQYLNETRHDQLDHTGLTGIPVAYTLPTASTTVLGGVKVDGTTVTITDGVISSSGSGMTNPMTAAGDIIYGGTSGAPTRLAKGTDGQVLTLASGLPSWAATSGGSLLVAETTVSGSARTEVTFSDLDGNADGGYVLVMDVILSNASYLYLQVNGDTTTTNYYTQLLGVEGTTISGATANNNRVFYSEACSTSLEIKVQSINNSCTAQCIGLRIEGGNAYQTQFRHIHKTTNTANITSITIVADGNYIAVGSTFRLYRRK